ncbi:putative retrotransposon hot spot protein 4 (RHS4) [Trypanosoma vivax]|nr:putative retrotransposon hot spot protein 4 (RHS4) [Trypanosoma vivax]
MEERMRVVGHAPQYVFDERSYERRKNEAEVALDELVNTDALYLLRVFARTLEWKDGGTAHCLVDLVRLGNSAIERCGNRPVSVAVRDGMLKRLDEIVVSDPRYSTPSITQQIMALCLKSSCSPRWSVLERLGGSFKALIF